MRIYKLSVILAVPLVLCLLVLAYFVYLDTNSAALGYTLVPLTALILIYLFSPQIDYWWISRNPVDLDEKVIALLNKINPKYNAMSDQEKATFNNQLFLYTEGRDFSGKGMEKDNSNVPHDIKMMIAQIPTTMTFHRTKNDFKDWERIILYKHPFPSPRYKFLHTMETFAEDGVVILSLEHVEKAILNPKDHYNVAWHAYAEAFIKANPAEEYPDLPSDIWNSIEKISSQDQRTIIGTLGFNEVDAMAVVINLYFNNEEQCRAVLPDISRRLDTIFIQK